MSNPIKVLRGQVRQVVNEVLPVILASELMKAMENRLLQYVKDRLDLIDQRSKDMQSYMVRQSAMIPAPSKPVEGVSLPSLENKS